MATATDTAIWPKCMKKNLPPEIELSFAAKLAMANSLSATADLVQLWPTMNGYGN